jgi:hypothetical protein
MIADCQLPIVNCRFLIPEVKEPIGNQQSEIDNPKTHPLPRGGTDLIVIAEFLWFRGTLTIRPW